MFTRLAIATLALALVAAGAGLAMAVGAQDGGSATQAGTVEITADAAIEITPADTPNGEAYALQRDGELALDFQRLNAEALTRADRVFTVTAEGVDPINVTAGNETATGIRLYRAGDPGTPMTEPVQLDPGESVDVGVSVDTTGSYSSGTIWINATAPNATTGGGPGSPGSGPGEGDGGDSEVSVIDADAAPTELTPGETATATATLANDGTVPGIRTVTLSVDGVVVDRQQVTVPAGGEATVAFDRQFQQLGTFAVAVGAVEAGTVTVASAPEEPGGPGDANATGGFVVTDASLSPGSIRPGTAATVSATVHNEGDDAGYFYAELAVGGVVVDEQPVRVPAGGSAEVTFERTFERQGNYEVAVSGVDAGTLRVESATASSMRRYRGIFAWVFGAASVPALGAGVVAVRRRRRRNRYDQPNRQ